MTTTSRPRLVFAAFLAAAVTVGCSATVSDTTAPAPSATTPANPTSDAARCPLLQQLLVRDNFIAFLDKQVV